MSDQEAQRSDGNARNTQRRNAQRPDFRHALVKYGLGPKMELESSFWRNALYILYTRGGIAAEPLHCGAMRIPSADDRER